MSLILSAVLFLTLSGLYLVPAGISYFAVEEGEKIEVHEIIVEISPSPTPTTPSPSPAKENNEEQSSVSLPTPNTTQTDPKIGTTAAQQNGDGYLTDDCDFEYHVDTREQNPDTHDVSIEHKCKQEVAGGSVNNDVNIKVNTGGNTFNEEENTDTQSGNVKIDVSIKNNVE